MRERPFYYRKFFHLSGSIVALGYLFIPQKGLYLVILLPFLLLFLIVDILRLNSPRINEHFFHLFSPLIAPKDSHQLNGSTYYLISSFLSILLFPKEVAVLSMLYLSMGDSTAAIIGKKFGKTKIFDKTLEGSLSCLLLCFLISLKFFNWKISLVGATSAMLIELFSSGDFRSPLLLDDNLLIPLLSGGILLLLTTKIL